MKHTYLQTLLALFAGSASAGTPFEIPLEFNATSGRITTKSGFMSNAESKLLVDTQFEYLATYTTDCVKSRQNLLGGEPGMLGEITTGPCPGDANTQITVTPELAAKVQSENEIGEIQWINPIQTYYMQGKFYPLSFCPQHGETAHCKEMSTLLVTTLNNTGTNWRYPFNGFFGLAPKADEGNEYSNFAQMLADQDEQVFSIFVGHDEEEATTATMEVGGYDLESYARAGTKESDLQWITDKPNDYYWSVALNNVYLYDGSEREPILEVGKHSVIFSTQQKDMSMPWDDYQKFMNNLERHGVLAQTEEKYFRCTDEFLTTLPDIQFEYEDDLTNNLVYVNLPWQSYVERMHGDELEDTCQLRIRHESFTWQIGTWARRQIYTIYRMKDGRMQLALVDAITKDASGRNDHAKLVRFVLIFVGVLAFLFIVFTAVCCIRKQYLKNAPKEVTFAGPEDEQKEKLNNLNASNNEETIDEKA